MVVGPWWLAREMAGGSDDEAITVAFQAPRPKAKGAAKAAASVKRERAAVGQEDTHAACDICEEQMPKDVLINIGNRNYPHFRCKPCKNAGSCLERDAQGRGDKYLQALNNGFVN